MLLLSLLITIVTIITLFTVTSFAVIYPNFNIILYFVGVSLF